jgi:valyl-tRNA synthetase
LYHFIWDVYANTYLEYAKIELKKDHRKKVVSAVLRVVLEDVIKLMHPFVPFITDALFEALTGKDSLMIESWPISRLNDAEASSHFDDIDMLITKVRNLRSEMQAFKPLDIIVKVDGHTLLEASKDTSDFIAVSVKASSLSFVQNLEDDTAYTPLTSTHMIAYFIPSDLVDPEKERAVMLEQKATLEKEIKRSEGLLKNNNFLAKANPEKIALEKEKYQGYLTQYEAIIKKLS